MTIAISEIFLPTAMSRRSRLPRFPRLLSIGVATAVLITIVICFASPEARQAWALASATLLSEDLTCIAAGQFTRLGQLHWTTAVIGCAIGIFLGDLGLYIVGRMLGRRLVRSWAKSRRVRIGRLRRRATWALMAARFLPGSRLPLYLAAGALPVPIGGFALVTAVASVIWTPLVVLGTAAVGETFALPFRRFLGSGWLAAATGAVAIYILIRAALRALTPIGRAELIARVSILWRWEFWPAWLFYAPVAVWAAILSLRYRGFATITAANPGVEHGGFVGESKCQILAALDPRYVLPFELIDEYRSAKSRSSALTGRMTARGWSFPIILKPDVGQRGAGVRLIHCTEEAQRYFDQVRIPVIAQVFHAGPYEAGIFYYRMPDEPRGRIFSITDKHFPELIGDGQSTLKQLIWRDRRYRMQAETFLLRHRRHINRVLGNGQRFRLVIAGNHCQGAIFRDGAHLLTPHLEDAIDRIAQSFVGGGFYFGRFDVRYSSIEAFKAGHDIAIVELNGVTSESTNVYDPSYSLLSAWKTMCHQWLILFRIAHANRQRGRRSTTTCDLLRAVIDHYRSLAAPRLAD